ncbi:MAG: hypothetical protein GF311_25700, partial [Candidatus Lokiarchaeota archaeon]|nr:hypothetical protein [Candidatus Lokiarchaeota archaeon]
MGLEKWNKSPHPLNGESISSWMIRTAQANLNSLSSLLDYIQDHYLDVRQFKINQDYDLNWFPSLFEVFSKKTEIAIDVLKRMSLSYLNFKVDEITKESSEGSWRNNIFQELWFTRWESRYGTGLRFCPMCLKEDPIAFFKNRWRLRYNTFCPDHKCLLENKCPKCGRYIAPFRLEWDYNPNQCYNCGFNLSSISPYTFEKNDKILKYSTEYLFNPQLSMNEIYNVLAMSWSVKYYDLDDNIFQNHPLTKDDELRRIWKGISNKYNRDNKRHLFSNIKGSFLLIGTAIKSILEEKSEKKPKYSIAKKITDLKVKNNDFPKWCEIFEGETISSWLIRTALENSMGYFSLISSFPKCLDSLDLYDLKGLDFIDFPALFKYLSKVSGQPYKSITQMIFSNYSEQLNLLTDKFYTVDDKDEFRILWKTQGIYNYEVGLKYCPVCLKEDNIPYFRKRWRLRYISFCFEHDCYLRERCPKCNRLIENYTVRWGAFNIKHCSRCSADLSQVEPEFLDLDVPFFSISKKYLIENLFDAEKIYSLLNKAWNEVSVKPLSDGIY